jgi:hypothetical protein
LLCALTTVGALFWTPAPLPAMLLLLATRPLVALGSATMPDVLAVKVLQVKVGTAGVSWKTPRMLSVT